MMIVRVYINERQVAEARAQNQSDLADVSTYGCTLTELKGPCSDGFTREFRIEGHQRKQTCWALVEKLAAMALRAPVGGPK